MNIRERRCQSVSPCRETEINCQSFSGGGKDWSHMERFCDCCDRDRDWERCEIRFPWVLVILVVTNWHCLVFILSTLICSPEPVVTPPLTSVQNCLQLNDRRKCKRRPWYYLPGFCVSLNSTGREEGGKGMEGGTLLLLIVKIFVLQSEI